MGSSQTSMMKENLTEENYKPAYLVPYGEYEQDEIKLVDLWAILVRRKWVLIIAFMTTLLIAIMFVMSLDSVYSSVSIFQIGKVVGEPIESVDNVVSSLRGQYVAGNGQRYYPSLKSVETEARLKSNLVTLTSQGLDPEEAREYLQRVTNEIMDKYKKYYHDGVKVQTNRIESLTHTLQNLRIQIDLHDVQVQNIDAKDMTQAILLQIEKSRLLGQVADLESELASLTLDLTAIGTRPPEVLKEPEANPNPIKPRRKLLILLSVMGSFLSGIFVAFFVDFVIRSRAEIMSS